MIITYTLYFNIDNYDVHLQEVVVRVVTYFIF